VCIYTASHSGAVLTFLISVVRYVLARLSAKNIRPANRTVLVPNL
jgi:hypothetical protein